MKNLLTQWEMRKKTDPKLELWQSFADLTIEPVLWLVLMACFRHLASALTNTNDEAEDLAVHCQACIYEFGSTLPISYPGLKAVQPCRVFIWVSRQSNCAA